MNYLFSGAIARIGGAQKRANGVASAKYSKRIKQLYVEFYKPKNIEKFRNTKISIERKAVA